jgi:hypothetical protein
VSRSCLLSSFIPLPRKDEDLSNPASAAVQERDLAYSFIVIVIEKNLQNLRDFDIFASHALIPVPKCFTKMFVVGSEL